MRRPIRTTMVYGLIGALTVVPAAWSLTGALGWPLAFKLALWLNLCGYAILLARWGGQGTWVVAMPLALVLGTALWPGVYDGFFCLGLGVLSWIRSGICFRRYPMRAAIAETIAMAGGTGLVALLGPGTPLSWAIVIWLFFLVQALYFFIVPLPDSATVDEIRADPFEQAHQAAQRLLRPD